ncbi:hypothetical protein O181_048772 [Austropuccinia psidii MF-1]|uniref:Uncharacterized protein n=1 Tax=Austropuccinia psidii MF-1 TaxID=1389203 RepID=A0A9Q3E0H9_9BASI|nr:hypothetical protein [Austropuccinia psidii MF-1]
MGGLGPFWPKSNVAKRGQGVNPLAPKARWVPSHKWAYLSPFFAKRALGPKLATSNHQGPPAQVQQGFPSIQEKTLPSSTYPVPKDPGVVHIWYNIALCTIFTQQSIGDGFRTQLGHFNPSPQIHHPFQRKTLTHSVFQYLAATKRPFKDPDYLALQELGFYFIQGLFKG